LNQHVRHRSLLATLAFCLAWLFGPEAGWSHSRGLYATQAEAEQRAKQLGCKGVHQNNGQWMPCSDEAMLHKELREE
jgi:hypothetical protein